MANNPKNNDKFFNESYHRKHWKIFYNYFKSKDERILDFGCGAGWGIKIGREEGFNIVGLDTIAIHKDRHIKFDEFRKGLNIHKYVELYNGSGRLPFKDNLFTMIVCRASFNKFRNQENKNNENELAFERLQEFSRILCGDRIVVITGSYFKEEFKKFDFKVYNWYKNGVTRLWKEGGSHKTSLEKANI